MLHRFNNARAAHKGKSKGKIIHKASDGSGERSPPPFHLSFAAYSFL
jgi:hypothetical protein